MYDCLIRKGYKRLNKKLWHKGKGVEQAFGMHLHEKCVPQHAVNTKNVY